MTLRSSNAYNPWNRYPFRRESLPCPSTYFKEQGIKLNGRGTWKTAICPFHDDTQPSLRVNVDKGAFKCMACGAKGGDVLDFHRRLHSLSFKAAAQDLNAWE